MKSFNRRKFFNKLSISALGAMFLTSFPINMLGKSKQNKNVTVKVKLHPKSVRRTK